MSRRILSATTCMVVLAAAVAFARPPDDRALPGQELEVSLLTIGPGRHAYELFGHNAILIRDSATGRGWAFNFGVFDFEQENFYWRFIQGRLLYQMAAFDADAMIRSYEADDRSMWIQELNLAPAQRVALFEYLRSWIDRPYLYDYYLNNCSTQVRDALDIPGVLNGAIRSATANVPTRTSFRWHTRRLTQGSPMLYLALETVLGSPIDRPITRWQELFLPQELQAVVRDLRMTGTDGQAAPLVASERPIYQSRQFAAPARPPRYAGWFGLLGAGIGGSIVALGRAARRGRWWNRGFVGLLSSWCLLLGAGGTISLWGWFFTDHWATRWNQNLLLADVLGLALAPLVLLMSRPWARYAAVGLAWAIFALGVIGLLLKMLPGTGQYNWDVIALTLPVWTAAAAALGWRTYSTRTGLRVSNRVV